MERKVNINGNDQGVWFGQQTYDRERYEVGMSASTHMANVLRFENSMLVVT